MIKNIFSILFLATATLVCAQTNEELYKQGIQCRKEYNNKDGFFIFQKLLKTDSNNINYITNSSHFYSRYGYSYAVSAEKIKYYKIAEYLALKAIKKDPSNAEAHYVYALALGRLNENASSKQKIANSKLIKSELDKTLKLNPSHAGAYHILGRWHRTIAGFGAIEKLAINALFGGVPEGGSYTAAVDAFKQAFLHEPKYKLHQFELAQTYFEMGRFSDTRVWAQKALDMPILNVEDKNTDIKSKELLGKLKD